MLIHFTLVYMSIAFQYSQPMLLKKLLEAINGDGSNSARSLAVVYALLMFLASICKTESDLQYLWFSRRVSGQLRCELMSTIYEKALKRKDLSGATKDKEKKEKEGEEKSDEEEKNQGADIGKIVNLMSNDAERLSDVAIGVFQIAGTPVEILISCVLLYRYVQRCGFKYLSNSSHPGFSAGLHLLVSRPSSLFFLSTTGLPSAASRFPKGSWLPPMPASQRSTNS